MIKRHYDSYIRSLKSTLDEIDFIVVERIIKTLLDARERDKQVFIIGNGGSATTASHLACDLAKWSKSRDDETSKRFRAISLTENVARMTAISNDLTYEDICVEQLKNYLNAGDILIAISASGNSPNIVKAVRYAKSRAGKTRWIPELESPESQIVVSHGIPFTNPATDQAIDLHWHVIHECRQPNADDKFWEGAVALKINEVTTCALSPADQLLHIFAHGIKWNPVPPFRWIADAMTVVRSSHSVIEWNRLITLAKEHRLVLPVRDALDYLGDKLDAPLPLYVLQTFKNIPTSRIERIEYKYKTENYLQKPLGYMPVIWFDYSRLSRDKTLPLKVIGFVRYLQSFWGAESIWRLPIYAISMTGRKLRSIKDYYRRR